MDNLFDQIKKHISNNDLRISEHGYDELADDGLSVREAVSGWFLMALW